MAVQKVLIWPDPVLAQKASAVSVFDDHLKKCVEDMFDTMYFAHGIGLAAPQIGVSLRVLVIDLSPLKDRPLKEQEQERSDLSAMGFSAPIALINPVIVEQTGSIVWEEGCLSVPEINDKVKRAAHVVVEAYDVSGAPIRIEAHQLFAVAIQHEMDHLNGKVFVEYLSGLKRDVIKRKMQKIRASYKDYYQEQHAQEETQSTESAL